LVSQTRESGIALFAAEGSTEAAQEAWSDTVQWIAENDPEAFQEGLTRYGRSFALGGAAGGGFVAAGGVSSELAGERVRLQRKLDERTLEQLRIRAARHGVSMEEEVRRILGAAVAAPERIGDLAVQLFGPANGVDLALSAHPPREPLEFTE